MRYLELSPFVDEKVLGFEISVQNSAGMTVRKTTQHLKRGIMFDGSKHE